MKSIASSLLVIVLALAPFIGESQSKENIVGSTYTFISKTYGAERSVQVYTPTGYESSSKKYPVLYLLDGQRWFLQGVSYQNLFAEYQYTPEFIVVGIDTDDAPRFGFLNNDEKLLKYLEQEVVQYIDENYKTAGERLLFGWQFAGAFALKVLAKKPELFSGYLVASPIPIDQSTSNLPSEGFAKPKTLYMTTAEKETQVNDGVNEFLEQLDNTSKSFRWERKVMNLEPITSFGHRTSPLGALYHGLRFYYDDYPLLEFDQLEDFNALGGVDYVYEYYQERGEKYGLSGEIPHEGMFFLVRLGLDVDDFPSFSRFMSDFIKKGFLDRTNAGWGNLYAEFYLQHKDPDGALIVYEKLVDRFPENARSLNGLGDAYFAKGDFKKAKKQYVDAVALAEKNSDRRLDEYKKDLEELKNRNNK